VRIDLYLVEEGLAASRTQAQDLIEQGRVFLSTTGLDGKTVRRPIKKSSEKIETAAASIDVEREANPFVSRGGQKLAGALRDVHLFVDGALALDIGLSTGGFADALLKAGASRVVGVDVGHSQLSAVLAKEPRLHSIEGVNARNLSQAEHKDRILALTDQRLFDVIVIDVSFISLTLILPETLAFLKVGGALLALVKPQFEVGRENLGKNGIVKNPAQWSMVETKIRTECERLGYQTEAYFESSIEGGDGNKEFFIFARRPAADDSLPNRT
jgi:23S rRNA (cytidine1920-2'-O)/16S rRNA (cytidine1409-2'-O)-methyltransferase